MKTKILILIIISTGLLAIMPVIVFAQSVTQAQPSQTPPYYPSSGVNLRLKTTRPISASGAGQGTFQGSTNALQNLRERADTEITRRINALNQLITRINDMQKISSAQKSDLQSQIQTQIDGLNALKTKIDADTDLTTLRTDVKSIVTDYRIFAFFIEYVNVMAASDRMQTVITNMQTVYTKLQTRIQTAQNNGQDVTSLDAELADMQTQINDSNTLVASVNTQIPGLTAGGYPNNKTILTDGKNNLQSAFADIKTAYTDAKTIIQSLRGLGERLKTMTGTSSAATK